MWCFIGFFDHDILKSVSQCSASFLGGFSQEIIVKYCQSAPPTQKNRTALVLPVLLRNSLASRQADPPDGNAEKGRDRFPGVGMDVNWPTTLRHDCWLWL